MIRNQTPTEKNGHHDCLKTLSGEERQETVEPPYTFFRNGHWEHSIEDTASTGLDKKNKVVNSRILMPTLVLITEIHLSKWPMHSDVHYSATSNTMTKTQENVHRQIKSYRNWYIYTTSYYSDMKNCHWNDGIKPLVTTRMAPGGSYTKWIQQQRKKIADDVPFRKFKKEIQRK